MKRERFFGWLRFHCLSWLELDSQQWNLRGMPLHVEFPHIAAGDLARIESQMDAMISKEGLNGIVTTSKLIQQTWHIVQDAFPKYMVQSGPAQRQALKQHVLCLWDECVQPANKFNWDWNTYDYDRLARILNNCWQLRDSKKNLPGGDGGDDGANQDGQGGNVFAKWKWASDAPPGTTRLRKCLGLSLRRQRR